MRFSLVREGGNPGQGRQVERKYLKKSHGKMSWKSVSSSRVLVKWQPGQMRLTEPEVSMSCRGNPLAVHRNGTGRMGAENTRVD